MHVQFTVFQPYCLSLGEDSSTSMTSGQMLLAGFNGLFTKVASELTDMFTAFERVHFDKHDLKFDIVRDAQELQVEISFHLPLTFFLFYVF